MVIFAFLAAIYLVAVCAFDMALAFPMSKQGLLGFVGFIVVAIGPLALLQLLFGR